MRDEYFCPNCNATLNYQSGFDPNRGSWTCTECGTHLMDDDVYDGDTFEGIAWYCDDCGALLNRQSGFSNRCGSWTCKKCGHSNSISEDEIISNDETMWCPSCGRALNRQLGFSDVYFDWKCTYCDSKLHREYYSDSFEVVDEDYDSDDCSDESADESSFPTNKRPRYVHQDDDDEFSQFLEKAVTALFKGIFWIIKMIGKLIFFIFKEIFNLLKKIVHCYTDPQKNGKISRKDFDKLRTNAFFRNHKQLPINNYYYDLLHRKVDTVKTILYNSGFKNIKAIPIKDLSYADRHRIGEVEQVVINGTSFFEPEDMFPYNAQIIITYHEKRDNNHRRKVHE